VVNKAEVTLPTTTTRADFRLLVRSPDDFTFFELVAAASQQLSNPTLRAAIMTRLFSLLTLPLQLVGAVLIGFAFSTGYRRSAGYGVAVLYGMLLGFVVFVVSELAKRAGSAGALTPAAAAMAPIVIAAAIGATVLLMREDGRV
jgi:lipopolysaccharide export system permease protein